MRAALLLATLLAATPAVARPIFAPGSGGGTTNVTNSYTLSTGALNAKISPNAAALNGMTADQQAIQNAYGNTPNNGTLEVPPGNWPQGSDAFHPFNPTHDSTKSILWRMLGTTAIGAGTAPGAGAFYDLGDGDVVEQFLNQEKVFSKQVLTGSSTAAATDTRVDIYSSQYPLQGYGLYPRTPAARATATNYPGATSAVAGFESNMFVGANLGYQGQDVGFQSTVFRTGGDGTWQFDGQTNDFSGQPPSPFAFRGAELGTVANGTDNTSETFSPKPGNRTFIWLEQDIAGFNTWAANTSSLALTYNNVAQTNSIQATSSTGVLRIYSVSQAGTTGSTQPTWPDSGSVTDGSVTWTMTTAANPTAGTGIWLDGRRTLIYHGTTPVKYGTGFSSDAVFENAGIDLSLATMDTTNSAAFRVAQDMPFDWTGTGQSASAQNLHITVYSSAASALQYKVGGTPLMSIADSGKTTLAALNVPLATPASATATCTPGDQANDASFQYLCTSTNHWASTPNTAFQTPVLALGTTAGTAADAAATATSIATAARGTPATANTAGTVPLNINLSISARAPGVNDDAAHGYPVGFIWTSPSLGRSWQSIRSNTGNAGWQFVSVAGGPLDLAPGAHLAYGPQVLSGLYQGPDFDLTRSGDGAVRTIAALPGGLPDVNTADAFCAAVNPPPQPTIQLTTNATQTNLTVLNFASTTFAGITVAVGDIVNGPGITPTQGTTNYLVTAVTGTTVTLNQMMGGLQASGSVFTFATGCGVSKVYDQTANALNSGVVPFSNEPSWLPSSVPPANRQFAFNGMQFTMSTGKLGNSVFPKYIAFPTGYSWAYSTETFLFAGEFVDPVAKMTLIENTGHSPSLGQNYNLFSPNLIGSGNTTPCTLSLESGPSVFTWAPIGTTTTCTSNGRTASGTSGIGGSVTATNTGGNIGTSLLSTAENNNTSTQLGMSAFVAWPSASITNASVGNASFALQSRLGITQEIDTNVVLKGDSTSSGEGSFSNSALPAKAAARLNQKFRLFNFGAGGQTCAGLLGGNAQMNTVGRNALARNDITVLFCGANDIRTGGTTATNVYANYQSIVQADIAAGAKVVCMTEPTQASIVANSTYQAAELAFNQAIEANWNVPYTSGGQGLGCSALVDYYNDPTIGTGSETSTAFNSAAAYATTLSYDGEHPTDLAQSYMAGPLAAALTAVSQ